MATQKQIIILEKVVGASVVSYKYALWAAVPLARQPFYTRPTTYKSAWKDAALADNTALQAGQIVELVESFSTPTSQSLAQIKALLEARFTAFQTDITSTNLWDRYGSYFDGVTWTNGGVA